MNRDRLAKIEEAVRRAGADSDFARLLIDQTAATQDHATTLSLLKRLVVRYADAEARISDYARELERKQARIADDLAAGAKIQQALLPRPVDLPGVEVAWSFIPCDEVGGDILLARPIGKDHLMVAVIDVSGHGIPAAMITVSVTQALATASGIVAHLPAAGEGFIPSRPIEVIRRLDAEYPFSRFRRYFTLAYGLLSRATGRFTYTLAGHPPPLLLRPGDRPIPLEGGGPLPGVGLAEEFGEWCIDLAPGDRLVFHSDGCYECVAPDGEIYGEARHLAAIERHGGRPLRAMIEAITADAAAFVATGKFQDDFTLVALEFTGPVVT